MGLAILARIRQEASLQEARLGPGIQNVHTGLGSQGQEQILQ